MKKLETEKNSLETIIELVPKDMTSKPEAKIVETDWSEYFDGLNGAVKHFGMKNGIMIWSFMKHFKNLVFGISGK